MTIARSIHVAANGIISKLFLFLILGGLLKWAMKASPLLRGVAPHGDSHPAGQRQTALRSPGWRCAQQGQLEGEGLWVWLAPLLGSNDGPYFPHMNVLH